MIQNTISVRFVRPAIVALLLGNDRPKGAFQWCSLNVTCKLDVTFNRNLRDFIVVHFTEKYLFILFVYSK